MMVLCPTCDEPFLPEYCNRCPWCGYRFADGYEVNAVDEASGEADSRFLAISLGVAALLLALALYFALLF